LTASAINQLPALSFSNSWFTGGFSSANTGNQVRGFTVATLAAAAGVYPRIFSLGRPGVNDYDSTTTTFLFVRNNSGQNIMVGRSGGANYVTVNIPAYSTPFLAQSGHNVNLTTIGLNGTRAPSSFNTGLLTNFNITSYGIGTNTNTADVHSFVGLIGEIINYTENLTTAQIQQVEGYLAWKWGLQANLPVGHLFKNNPTTMRVFQPVDVPNCLLWLDGADTSTLSVTGSSVTEWRDKVSSRVFTAQGNASFATVTDGINGRQCVSLDNSSAENVYFQASLPSISTGSFFYVIQAKSQRADGFRPFATWFNSGGNFPAFGYLGGTGNNNTVGPYTTFVGSGTPAQIYTPNENFLIFYGFNNGNTSVGRLGATPTAGSQGSFSAPGTTSTFWLGADGSSEGPRVK
jgi:hypothetical protein